MEAAHPAGEHVFCSPSRWRTCVLQPTPRRTVGSRAYLLRERRIRGPTHSETTCSLASPSLHESLQGLRTYPHLWCMRVFLRGAGAYFQDVYVRTCAYVFTYGGTYVRKYVTYVRMQIQVIRYSRDNRSVVVLFAWLVFLRSDVWPCEGICRMGMGGKRGRVCDSDPHHVRMHPALRKPLPLFFASVRSKPSSRCTYVRTSALTYFEQQTIKRTDT